MFSLGLQSKALTAFEQSCNIIRSLIFKKIILALLKGDVRDGKHKSGKNC